MKTDERSIALPTRRLLTASTIGAAAVGAAWFAAATVAGWSAAEAMIGVYGAGVAAIAMAAGLLLIGPWVERPISLWMTLWLGSTMVRFIVALAGAWVLYSALPVSPWSLVAGVGGAYFVALLSEVVVLAGCLKRMT